MTGKGVREFIEQEETAKCKRVRAGRYTCDAGGGGGGTK